MTHNILPTMGNKYLVHYRNQINQQNIAAVSSSTQVASTSTAATTAPPDVLNINQSTPQQQQQQHQSYPTLMHQNSSAQTLSCVQPSTSVPPEIVHCLNNLNISDIDNSSGCSSNVAPNSSGMGATGSSSLNVNNAAINLELNELRSNKQTKTLPKGGNKRPRPTKKRDADNIKSDLNLACSISRYDSK